jgi:hypothetical protein
MPQDRQQCRYLFAREKHRRTMDTKPEMAWDCPAQLSPLAASVG